MKAIEVLEILKTHAIDYREDASKSVLRNNHMNNLLDFDHICQDYVDAVLVDFINHIGMKCGVDYALYTTDIGGEVGGKSREKLRGPESKNDNEEVG